jgi:peptidoglycan/LPS O-acetylase OafA/YrhL
VAVVAIVLAHFCYRLVEQPMIARGRQIVARRKAVAHRDELRSAAT